MGIDSYVEDIVIRARIDEARRAGARAQLLERARQATARRRPWAVMHRFIEAVSSLWLNRRSDKEGMAVR